MILKLSRLSSLENLSRASCSGQAATLLILIMVGFLMFILTTVNIGQVSVNSTQLSNAADSAALSLASQLATRSHAIWESLGHKTEKCIKTGMLSMVLAIVVALIFIIVLPMLAPALLAMLPGFMVGVTAAGVTALSTTGAIVMGAIGGFIGGAIGGGIVQGTAMGALTGGAQGAAIGAAIGMGYAGIVGSPAGGSVAAPSGAAVPVAGGSDISFSVAEMTNLLNAGAAPASTGAAVMGSMSVAGSIYNAVVAEQNISSAFSQAAKAINGLPSARARIRESVFFQALSQTVDDPNKDIDEQDLDTDGDIEEKLPHFLYWWNDRIEALKEGISLKGLKRIISKFLEGPLLKFKKKAKSYYVLPAGDDDKPDGAFCRQEIEGQDGKVVELLRGLESSGYAVSFWEPGPSKQELNKWLDAESICPDCDEPPKGYDELDGVVEELKIFVKDAKSLLKLLEDSKLGELASDWEFWIEWFYQPKKDLSCESESECEPEDDPEDGSEHDSSYYVTLEEMVKGSSSGILGLEGWNKELLDIRYRLPLCGYSYNGVETEITNSPCKDDSKDLTYGSIDSNINDEFGPAIRAIDKLIKKIEAFRPSLPELYNDLAGASLALPEEFGGKNPVTYRWADNRCPAEKNPDGSIKKDDQGKVIYKKCHSIKVKTAFKLPKLKKKKSGNFLKGKICLKLVNGDTFKYRNDENKGNWNWVKITRREPANQSMGVMGSFNPQDRDDGRYFSLSRKSVAFFRYNRIPKIKLNQRKKN